jgi:hypothetical protein|tara:strand:+ start:193 stop:417 length:225 start_codon:yes stop_codon:yes gene_type:complete
MADKKKKVDPIIAAAMALDSSESVAIEERAEKPMGTKRPEMTIEEILAAEKKKIRAAELQKQAIVDKKQSAAKK